METQPARNPDDRLPRAIHYQVAHTLRGFLPASGNDAAEDAAHYDIALGLVASLRPATADEAHLATGYVAASIHAIDCIRLAREHPTDAAIILKCTAQSASMMRQARSWRALLDRTQTARQASEADAAARASAAQDAAARESAAQERALALMAAALAEQPAPVAPPANPRSDPVAQAETYARQHRKRAMLIRSLGRLPDKLNVGALPPEVVHAIANGATPALQALGPRRYQATAAAT